jgi:pyrroloquinoline quinone biosynthesis protein B
MVIRILGSAAGGGVPQWNCGCRQCVGARVGLVECRTQCSVAISTDGHRWILINASPDLRSQLFHLHWQPRSETRDSPIEAVLLSDADLDHTLGLFLMRENSSFLSIHASAAIKDAVEKGLRLTEILDRYCGVRWTTPPTGFEPLPYHQAESGLEYKAIELDGPGPRYGRSNHRSCRVFYVLREMKTGKSVLVAPAVSRLEPKLLAELDHAEAILFDGSFWSADDFEKSGINSRYVSELLQSHLPISNGSFESLAAQHAIHKIYIHLNNTNPILWRESPERRLLEKAEIKVAADGMTIEL